MNTVTEKAARSAVTTAQLPLAQEPRNPGMPLDMDWVRAVQANTSAIERRAASLPGRRSVKKEFQAAWLLKAITMIDLTTLAGDDTAGRVWRLCGGQSRTAGHPRRPRLGADHDGRGLRLPRHDRHRR